MKWKTFDNSVHTFFPFWMTHAVEKCHTSLGFPLQALLHWRAFKRGHIAPLLLALSPGFVLVYSLSTCDRAFMCVCQTRWGRWPPSIRQVQRSDLRWPNSEGYRRSRHVIVSKPGSRLNSRQLFVMTTLEGSQQQEQTAVLNQVWVFG